VICQIWEQCLSSVKGQSHIQGAESQQKQEEAQQSTCITQQGTHLHSQCLL